MKIKNIIAIVAIVAVVIGFFYFFGKGGASSELDSFAQCLKEKNVTMYGAYYCSHCLEQKKDFGPSFQYVPYVECTQERAKCAEQNITAFPTWVFPGGKKIEGKMSMEDLAKESGCVLPKRG